MPKDAFQQAADDQSIGSLANLSAGGHAPHHPRQQHQHSSSSSSSKRWRKLSTNYTPEIQQEDLAVKRQGIVMMLSLIIVGLVLSVLSAHVSASSSSDNHDADDDIDDDEEDEDDAADNINDGIRNALIVAGCFAALVMVFLRYDALVRQRHAALVTITRRSKTIVDQLFPSNVRDRLLYESSHRSNSEDGDGIGNSGFLVANNNTTNLSNNNNKSGLSMQELTKRNTLRNTATAAKEQPLTASLTNSPQKQPNKFLQQLAQNHGGNLTPLLPLMTPRGGGGGGGEEDVGVPAATTKIAEMYHETTVFFADIAGFTAWSAQRDPQQVFTLLETVYNAFDEIAQQLRIFKVETIGDSYMAVSGLPKPDDDHAIHMAKFAYQCVQVMNKVTADLESALGPGTTSLTIRVGMHSGPVTGGVLRGQKSRFQLFGDTVNTASRMESTGAVGRIQVSQETAEELRVKGKAHWLRPREDKIVAKGKGELQTYWLEPRKKARQDTVSNVPNGSGSNVVQFPGDEVQQTKSDPQSSPKTAANVLSSAKSQHSSRSISKEKRDRLIEYNTDVLLKPLLRSVSARQTSKAKMSRSVRKIDHSTEVYEPLLAFSSVSDSIPLPEFDPSRSIDGTMVTSDIAQIREELRNYVAEIAAQYNNVPFHNFEHASHVILATNKLMDRMYNQPRVDPEDLYDLTYGISSDPLTHFSMVLAALVHDLGHLGIPNAQLVKEEARIAVMYDNQSVAEQHSLSTAWKTLLKPRYKFLRECIYTDNVERKRFRQVFLNAVMSTDIANRELLQKRTEQWERAFQGPVPKVRTPSWMHERATALLTTIIQVANISHTMQHWTIYRRWNEMLFVEMNLAYEAGRASFPPAEHWYRGELAFFDNYVLPLAKRLHESGVYSNQYLKFAMKNRTEWESTGVAVVDMMQSSQEEVVEEGEINDDDSIMEGSAQAEKSRRESGLPRPPLMDPSDDFRAEEVANAV